MKNFIIKLISCFIPCKNSRKKFRNYHLYSVPIIKENSKKFKKISDRIKTKVSNNEKISVAFLVVFESVFPAKRLFELMQNDDLFEPYILIIPDTSRGEKNMFDLMNKSFKSLSEQYPNKVFKSFDEQSQTFKDFSDKCDIMCGANPYDIMTKDIYGFKYWSEKSLIIYINYGCMPDYYAINNIINLPSLNMCWKVFVDTIYNLNDVIKFTDIKGKNAELTGYAKMDLLPKNYKNSERKKIIIAPHHTVGEEWNKVFGLSNFLTYSNFFLELPKLYPQIDWVFRPHPLLMVTLKNRNIWHKKKLTIILTN